MRLGGRLPVLAGTAAGVAAAAVLTLLQASTYRADASVALVRQGQPPGDDPALARAADAATELFHSRAVAEPAIANLRLEEPAGELLDRTFVRSEAESSLVRLTVEGPSRDEARRTVQELTELATVLFNDRYGPGTVATVWEAPRAQDDRVSPRPARNLALGALLGALVGLVLATLAGSALPRPRRPVRVRQALAPTPVPAPVPPPKLVSEPVLEPLPEPVPAPPSEPEPAGPFVLPRLGEWHQADVERLLAEQGPAFPERGDELRWYLESFRDVAESDGRLPGGVEAVMEDVFRDLIDRARPASPPREGD
jgi:capsular polysaccharide biosynthesis protein